MRELFRKALMEGIIIYEHGIYYFNFPVERIRVYIDLK